MEGKSVARNEFDGKSMIGVGGAARVSQSVSSTIRTPPASPAPTTSSVATCVRRISNQVITTSGIARMASWATPTKA